MAHISSACSAVQKDGSSGMLMKGMGSWLAAVERRVLALS